MFVNRQLDGWMKQEDLGKWNINDTRPFCHTEEQYVIINAFLDPESPMYIIFGEYVLQMEMLLSCNPSSLSWVFSLNP